MALLREFARLAVDLAGRSNCKLKSCRVVEVRPELTVLTPVAVSNFFPRITNGQFVFSHSADPGLR